MLICRPSSAGSRSAPRVSMLCSIRCCKFGCWRQQIQQHTVAEQIGDFIPVADRMQALLRKIIGVIAASPALRAQPIRAA